MSVITPRIAFADSNEISAVAVDKYTREPIEGVHVVIYQGGSTIVAEGETGADGYFRPYLPLPDGALLELNKPLIKRAMFIRSTLFLTFSRRFIRSRRCSCC